MLEFILRENFHHAEPSLVHKVTVNAEYHKHYSFIDVEAHYSEEGKTRTDEIIATVMKAKKVLADHVNLKMYADIAQEIRTIFNSKPIERGTRIARRIAEGILKYGYVNAYSAMNVLGHYDKNYVNMILDNIDYGSLLIVI